MRGSVLVDRVQLAVNHEERPVGAEVGLIVLHYTGMKSGAAAVDWLCNPVSRVSCHYLVDTSGEIVQMVSEDRRAWHAGVSSWKGEVDINSRSIGIEIQNEGHAAGCPPFPDAQMTAVARLCLDVMQRYSLRPEDVVAHSDVAPGRKIDPGEAFDWPGLARWGIGQVVSASQGSRPHTVDQHQTMLAQERLHHIGYGVGAEGDRAGLSKTVLQAFQRRYRQRLVDGILDAETLELIVRVAAIQSPEGADHRV